MFSQTLIATHKNKVHKNKTHHYAEFLNFCFFLTEFLECLDMQIDGIAFSLISFKINPF